MRIINQNILDIKYGIIAHQVQLFAPDGSQPSYFSCGLAKQIALQYPYVEHEYRRLCSQYNLGDVQFVTAVDSIRPANVLMVANCFAQTINGTYKRQTNYGALAECLIELDLNARYRLKPKALVYIPYGIGCGPAGGDWDVVSELIETFIPNAIICKCPAKRQS